MDSINPGASSGRGGRGHLNAQKARNGPRTSSRLAAKLDTYGTSAPSKERFAKPVLLKVLGVKQSKAASNPDGGERSLVVFLEKKASKNLETPIKINKVCGYDHS